MRQKLIIRSEVIRGRVLDLIKSLPLEPPSEITVAEYKTKRSNDQNALHWKRLDVVRLHVADSTGQVFSAEELHEFFKAKFLPVRLVEVGGQSEPVRRTTTGMNTKEFSEFMDSIDRYCIDHLNLYLPTPEIGGDL